MYFSRHVDVLLLHSVAPALQQVTTDPRLCWRLLARIGESGAVSCGVSAPFSWVLVCTSLCLCPPRVCVPALCKFWQLYGGVNGDLFQEGLCHTRVCCTLSPRPCGSSLPPQEMPKHSSVSVSVGSLGPSAHKVCLSLLSVSDGNGV